MECHPPAAASAHLRVGLAA